MAIDPEELREKIVASREQIKHLVHKLGAPSRSFKATGDVQVEQEASPAVEAPSSAMDYIEVVALRRLSNGAAIRYRGRFCDLLPISCFSNYRPSITR